MLQKKSKTSMDPQLALKSNVKKKHNTDEVIQPVEKKSKKRKSEQNRTGDRDIQTVADNQCDESRVTEEKPSPAKKERKQKSPEGQKSRKGADSVDDAGGANIKKMQKKKRNYAEDIIAEQVTADNQHIESSETGADPPPTKKERKPRTLESHKTTKAAESTEDGSSKKKKRKKKKKKKTSVITPKDQDVMSERCTSYLQEWKENRSAWKFQKLYQIWLVQNMLDESRVPEDIFPIFLEYISGAQGQTIKIINEKATKVIEEAEKNEADLDDPKLVRARSIIQAVATD